MFKLINNKLTAKHNNKYYYKFIEDDDILDKLIDVNITEIFNGIIVKNNNLVIQMTYDSNTKYLLQNEQINSLTNQNKLLNKQIESLTNQNKLLNKQIDQLTNQNKLLNEQINKNKYTLTICFRFRQQDKFIDYYYDSDDSCNSDEYDDSDDSNNLDYFDNYDTNKN
jgi:hypothetical protein